MPRSFTQLTLDERRLLARLRDADVPVARIAERLGRRASTIYREMNFTGVYPSWSQALPVWIFNWSNSTRLPDPLGALWVA